GTIRTAMLLAAVASRLAAQTASMEGTVINRATGAPLAGVHLRMVTGNLATQVLTRTYGAITDRAGHFSIKEVIPGVYFTVLERPGFVEKRDASAIPWSITLKAGDAITNQKFEMLPRALLAGRVL